jgi:AcrR family transcriptional regulator
MPRGFTEEQRTRIRDALMQAGREQFARLGLKRANVADLAAAAGIAKGSFYLFFESKEDLFFDILERVQAEQRAPLELALTEPGAQPKEVFRSFLKRQLLAFDTHPFLTVLTRPNDLEALLRRVPPEKLAAHRADDEAWFTQLVERWQGEGIFVHKSPRVVFGMVTSLVFLVLHKHWVGEDVFEDVIELLIDTLCDSLFLENQP